MKYSILESPFNNIISVRNSSIDHSFRPAATGYSDDIENLKLRTMMEARESSIALASAAHLYDGAALNNSLDEYIERASVAIWWHMRQPFIEKTAHRSIDEFNIYSGTIKAINKMGLVAICLLENQSEYPYFVLGSAYSKNLRLAEQKAFMESIQSWVGSQWLRDKKHPVYWDIEELECRKNQLITPQETLSPPKNTVEYFHKPYVEIEHIGKIAIANAYLDSVKEPIDSISLAGIITGKEPVIFSHPNM